MQQPLLSEEDATCVSLALHSYDAHEAVDGWRGTMLVTSVPLMEEVQHLVWQHTRVYAPLQKPQKESKQRP